MRKQALLAFSATLLLSVILVSGIIQQSYAAPQVNVGDKFNVISKRGQAATNDTGTVEKFHAELTSLAQVTAVSGKGFNFTIIEGKIGVGETTYTVTRAGGVFRYGDNQTHVLLRGEAIAPDGTGVHFLLKGQARLLDDLLALKLEGGLQAAAVQYRLRFLAEAMKA